MKRILMLIASVVLIVSIFSSSSLAITTDSQTQNRANRIYFESYISNTGNDTEIGIGRIKNLFDFAGNKYTLIECEPIGYFIYHDDSGKFVEESYTSVSPYLGYSGKLYYAGPTEYYVKNGNRYEHTILSESIDEKYEEQLISQSSKLADALTQNANSDVLEYMSTSISDTEELKLMADNITSATYTYKWIPNYSYLSGLSTNFGYYEPNGNGVCGYIAANLVLYYWQRSNSSRSIIPSTWWNTSGLVGNSLTKKLVDIGYPDYGYDTWGYEIRNVLISYCNWKGISATSSYYLLGGYVWSEIDAGRPVIEFGNLYLPGGGTGNHAVTVYGYKYLDSDYKAIAHFGWSGYSSVVIDPVTIGSVTTFRLT